MRMISLLLILYAILLLSTYCTNDVAPNLCGTETAELLDVSYSHDISPIIATSCALPNCHVANFPNGDFTFYNDLKARADNGELYFRLSNGQMPPANSNVQLTVCDVNTIVQWINEGAKNN
ncbi:MAG TPA: hypothetical protein VFU05_00185 [Cyclobacteriaceae bacterium]|nr:hypothetical protein [Cyclobacteriaceae bacterium]